MPRSQIGQSISQQGFFSSSRDSLSVPCVSQPLHSHVSATTSEMDLSRKGQKKDRGKLKPGEQPLLGSWNQSAPRETNPTPIGASASTNHLDSGNNNGNGCGESTERLVLLFFLTGIMNVNGDLVSLSDKDDDLVVYLRHIENLLQNGHLCSTRLVDYAITGQWWSH